MEQQAPEPLTKTARLRPSPRVTSAADAPLSAENFDDVLEKLVQKLVVRAKRPPATPLSAGGIGVPPRRVKSHSAAIEILESIEEIQNMLMWSLGNAEQSGRIQLMAVCGDDCARISRTHAVLDAIMSSGLAMNFEDRVRKCQRACGSVEKVLKDIGLAAELRKAKDEEARKLLERTQKEPITIVTCDDESPFSGMSFEEAKAAALKAATAARQDMVDSSQEEPEIGPSARSWKLLPTGEVQVIESRGFGRRASVTRIAIPEPRASFPEPANFTTVSLDESRSLGAAGATGESKQRDSLGKGSGQTDLLNIAEEKEARTCGLCCQLCAESTSRAEPGKQDPSSYEAVKDSLKVLGPLGSAAGVFLILLI